MDTYKSDSLSITEVIKTTLINLSKFAQVPGTATCLAVDTDPVLPWALGVRIPLVKTTPPTLQLPALSQWTRTTNNPPVNIGTALLLTDGTVIAHEENDQGGNVATNKWYK